MLNTEPSPSNDGFLHLSLPVQQGFPDLGIPRMYSIKDVQILTGGKSRSTIYRWIVDGYFPAPIRLGGKGGNSAVWPEEAITTWREQIIKQQNQIVRN